MKPTTLTLIALPLVAALAAGTYWLGRMQGESAQAPANTPEVARVTGMPQKAGDVDAATGRKVLYWHDPMVPGQKFDRPGKSPFMDMMLEPVYADSGADEGTVTISPRVRQNIGVRTAEATRGRLESPLTAVGTVAYNERDQALVQARASGFVEKLHVRATLDAVRRDQPLVDIYVPDWVAAQEEFLAVRRLRGPGIESLVDAARQRMRLAGMTDAQIERVETSGALQPRLTLVAPISGVVTELAVREGMTVAMAAPLFRINGLSSVWINAEVPESAAVRVRAGAPVEVRTPAAPGAVLKGKVSAVLPQVDAATRTIKARIEVGNPGGQLVPGLFAAVDFLPTGGTDVTLVPSEAIVATGKRTVVFVDEGDGRFRPVDVDTGIEGNGMTEVRRGLQPGDRVVVSGQFLIDSDASLKGVTTRLADPAAGAPTPAMKAPAAAPTDAHAGHAPAAVPVDAHAGHVPAAKARP
ncbi:MAG: efflux RND transporter periplasmic adaptor subunit [Burkholderiales bacterium]|nr:efflux RND transporter periplasmic adaptor subunit [Burkholderiales bacterium]